MFVRNLFLHCECCFVANIFLFTILRHIVGHWSDYHLILIYRHRSAPAVEVIDSLNSKQQQQLSQLVLILRSIQLLTTVHLHVVKKKPAGFTGNISVIKLPLEPRYLTIAVKPFTCGY